VLDQLALLIMLDPSLAETERQARLTSLLDNECPHCGAKGPHEDNDKVGEDLTYFCAACRTCFDAPEYRK
jgi:hypothetical protein